MKLLLNFLLGVCLAIFIPSAFYAQDVIFPIIDKDNALSKKERRSLERMISYKIGLFNEIFQNESYSNSEIDFIIIKDYATYLTYKSEAGRTVPFASSSFDGFYSSDTKQIVVCRDNKSEALFLRACYSGLSDLPLRERVPHLPIWLDRGLFLYTTLIKVSSRGMKHEMSTFGIKRVKTMIELKDIDLRDFVTWSSQKFHQVSSSHDNYGRSLAHNLVYFLMNKDREAALNIIRSIADRITTVEAFDMHYSGGFDQFEKDFLAHYSK